MVLFVVGGYGAQMMARSRTSPALQYAGLALYVLLEVVIFLPILMIADIQISRSSLASSGRYPDARGVCRAYGCGVFLR